MTMFSKVEDLGKDRKDYGDGGTREDSTGKPRWDLVPLYPLYRLMQHYVNGAKKYDENQWQKGIPVSRHFQSLKRHLFAFESGDESEDHLAAIAWNTFAIMWTQRAAKVNIISKKYDDTNSIIKNNKRMMCE